MAKRDELLDRRDDVLMAAAEVQKHYSAWVEALTKNLTGTLAYIGKVGEVPVSIGFARMKHSQSLHATHAPLCSWALPDHTSIPCYDNLRFFLCRPT